MGEKKMEGEDSVSRVDCLRGRLLAERAASRNAKEEAEQLQNKLIELEKLLKQEAKSRKRAEKKLKFLMKKLESINITPHDASDGSQHSESIDKTDISSISSTPSSITKQQLLQQQQSNQNEETKILDSFEIQESEGKDLGDLEQTDSQNSSFSLSGYTYTAEGTSVSSAFESLLPEYEATRDKDEISKIFEQRNTTFEDSLSEKSNSNLDQQSDVCYLSIRSSADEEGHDCDTQIDNSMALVLVNNKSQKISQRIDPDALDETVRGVLDTLQRAKDELRSSMERRRMNMMRVGGKIKTSTVFI